MGKLWQISIYVRSFEAMYALLLYNKYNSPAQCMHYYKYNSPAQIMKYEAFINMR